jgi:hypothetical protein
MLLGESAEQPVGRKEIAVGMSKARRSGASTVGFCGEC